MKTIAVLVSLAVYDGLAMLLLYQWDSAAHWKRLDLFSGFYLSISTALAIQQMVFAGRLPGSSEVKDVFFAKRIQPTWNKFVGVLGVLELAVFFDYGHLHTARQPELVALQSAGLVLDVISFAWLMWVDAYLLKNFVPKLEANAPMLYGPYTLVRHPLIPASLGRVWRFHDCCRVYCRGCSRSAGGC